ncbi:hypothetical protein APR12_001321 [Nocardia amikacinitolerans]|uniref:hypothetical protein n=1 Tax=Nocardia amikacinitolerans TaxID=756689 RepID=UPI00082F8B5C|nr:hypothetical protein [Nocardia amikacinitolerans]MCP2315988.1 hypothetical protein [Nocardia amikacinitolerans]
MTIETEDRTDQASETQARDLPAELGRTSGTVSIRLSAITIGVALIGLVVATGVFAALWMSARSELSDRDASAAGYRHAEQVATDYAVGASTINFQDYNAWIGKLKANTSPQLANKFDATAPKLQEILVPLKWSSTAAPINAIVTSENGGVYKVNVFLNVNSTNAQTPDGGQTTVTYNVTVDSGAGWKITDVGGMDGALPLK